MEPLKANIIEGIYIRVSGEAGKTNGLPLHILVNMLSHLQELVQLLAKYELETDKSPNLEEFELELFDYKPGSAVPAVRIRNRYHHPNLFQKNIIEEQKEVVAKRLDTLLSYADKSQYEQFFPQDQLDEVKYEIADELYGFILAADNSPIAIVEPTEKENQFREIYKVPKFSKQQSEALLRPKKRRRTPEEPEQIFALVQRIGKRKKIVDLYENKDTILSIAPIDIVLPDRTYLLHSPLFCSVSKEDGNFIIQNEMLDLYASGETIDQAEHDLYQEFHDSYTLLQNLNNEELSERLLRAKNMMHNYIKEIIYE